MKKYFLVFSFSFFIYYFSFGQDPTPNGGFENWTQVSNYYIPDGWDNLNAATSILGQVTCIRSTDAHSGNFACKLQTKDVIVDTANGIITTGTLVLVPPYGVVGGIPFNGHPDSIVGWYKYSPTLPDTLLIEFDLFDVNNLTIGSAVFETTQSPSQYKRFSVPLQYFSGGTPDTSRWLISSSIGYFAQPGSTLYVDDIALVYNTAVPDLLKDDQIILGPNPSDKMVTLKTASLNSGVLIIFNLNGQRVKEISFYQNEFTLDVNDLPASIFQYEIMNENGTALYTNKMMIVH